MVSSPDITLKRIYESPKMKRNGIEAMPLMRCIAVNFVSMMATAVCQLT